VRNNKGNEVPEFSIEEGELEKHEVEKKRNMSKSITTEELRELLKNGSEKGSRKAS